MEIKDKIKLNLSEDFYKEEVRCEYLVTQKTKKTWAIELDLLNELLRVCKKHNIKLIAYAGTILGAVRHKGFIPWDDDIDVALTRPEYEKLLKVAPLEFKEPYFFQTALSDREYFLGYARLRNSLTTGIITSNKSLNYNNGIYIDIFVIDSYTHDEKRFDRQITLRDKYIMLFDTYRSDVKYNNILSRTIKSLFSLIVPYRLLVFLYNRNLSKYNNQESRLSLMTHEMPFIRKYWCTNSDMEDIIYVPFEDVMIPVPKNYDEVLTHMYGDYMEFPPVEKRGAWHEGQLEFDPDISYKEYLIQHKDDI